jgi:uncharacterized protein
VTNDLPQTPGRHGDPSLCIVAARVGVVAVLLAVATACGPGAAPAEDANLAAFIGRLKAVDNHAHANSTAPGDSDADALPLDGLPPFSLPARLRPESPLWLDAYRAMYGYRFTDLTGPHFDELRNEMKRVSTRQGAKFPEWVLDRIGTEVMLANRVAIGPGLESPRFRWVSYVDALLLPLSTADERAATPDYQIVYPLEEKLLQRYLSDLQLAKVPPTLEEYLRAVVTATLERQRQAGCVAVKFEVAYLRGLDFDEVSPATAAAVYGRFVGASKTTPSHSDYKALQDFLFRYIAGEAGRLGLAVHIHTFEGAGGFYRAAGSDPLLLEPVLNDPALRKTRFVLLHGGGIYASHVGALLWKPNVYVDTSLMSLVYTPDRLASILRDWLVEYPERVLFGSDAFANGPDAGWELAAWASSSAARHALGVALTGLVRSGEISSGRAEIIATMVMRENANRLYDLRLPL